MSIATTDNCEESYELLLMLSKPSGRDTVPSVRKKREGINLMTIL